MINYDKIGFQNLLNKLEDLGFFRMDDEEEGSLITYARVYSTEYDEVDFNYSIMVFINTKENFIEFNIMWKPVRDYLSSTFNLENYLLYLRVDQNSIKKDIKELEQRMSLVS